MNKNANVKNGSPVFRSGMCVRQGAQHYKLHIGLQDACSVHTVPGLTVAAVCDGCSSAGSGYSVNQAGAVLAADYIAGITAKRFAKDGLPASSEAAAILAGLRENIHDTFRALCRCIGLKVRGDKERYRDFVRSRLTFTVLVLVADARNYWIFGAGDGCYGSSTEVCAIAKTPYLNESLLRTRNKHKETLELHAHGSLDGVQSLWIASDGLSRLFELAEGEQHFRQFLNDELTCTRNERDEDTTGQAFNRRVFNFYDKRLPDDVALAVLRNNAT